MNDSSVLKNKTSLSLVEEGLVFPESRRLRAGWDVLEGLSTGPTMPSPVGHGRSASSDQVARSAPRRPTGHVAKQDSELRTTRNRNC